MIINPNSACLQIGLSRLELRSFRSKLQRNAAAAAMAASGKNPDFRRGKADPASSSGSNGGFKLMSIDAIAGTGNSDDDEDLDIERVLLPDVEESASLPTAKAQGNARTWAKERLQRGGGAGLKVKIGSTVEKSSGKKPAKQPPKGFSRSESGLGPSFEEVGL